MGLLDLAVSTQVSPQEKAMAHSARMKGSKKNRGAKGGGISQAKANNSHHPKVLPLEVLMGEQPFPGERLLKKAGV